MRSVPMVFATLLVGFSLVGCPVGNDSPLSNGQESLIGQQSPDSSADNSSSQTLTPDDGASRPVVPVTDDDRTGGTEWSDAVDSSIPPEVLAALLQDSDKDGRTDLDELVEGTNPNDPSDGPDIDGDGVPNDSDPDIDGDGIPNAYDDDVDGDGLLNKSDPDMDGDGKKNDVDDDPDGDGIEKKKDNDAEEDKGEEILVRAQSLSPLKRKLLELVRTKAFDVKTASPIDPSKYLVPGRVTVFDLSYTGDYEKNLLIAQLLERVFKAKRDDSTLPKTMIMIEEAHTFVSRENKDRMMQTIRKLKEIARRGRKRWLSLCFISQQPAHLPSEIFELANTRIVHNIRSKNNLEVLKLSSGDVTEEMWDSVPALNPGQAIINSPQFKNSLVVEVRHCRSKRIKQE